MTAAERIAEVLTVPPPDGETIDWVAERFLNAVAGSNGVTVRVVPRPTDPTRWRVEIEEAGEVRYADGPTPRRLFRVLAARLAVKAAEESGGPPDVYSGKLLLAGTSSRGPVRVEFENTSRAQRITAVAYVGKALARPVTRRRVRDLLAVAATPVERLGRLIEATAGAEHHEAWPEIDRLSADAAVDLSVRPTWYSAGKVLFDYLVTLALLPPALLLTLLAALAVKLTSPGPMFYTQVRLGLNGRRYRILKIRTMYQGCEAKTGVGWSTTGDDRITPVGRFLRATYLDELPQLFNVLLGHMSLVGPRPERPEVIKAKGLERLVPGYAHRLLVKPGVTGIAQVQLPADSDVASVRRKVVYDLYYVENQGLLLDLRLILATVLRVLGIRPVWLRRLFLLPSRRVVASAFLKHTADQRVVGGESLAPGFAPGELRL